MNSTINLRMGSLLANMWVPLWLLARGISSLMLTILPAQADGRQPVVVELVLALDSSASVDRKEFQLQLDGLALAFRNPEVLDAVDNLRPLGAAVAVVQWGAPGETRVVLPFTHLEGARDAKAFGFRIGLIRRWMRASATSIATGIDDSRELIQENGFDGVRKIIDVSGDGPDNSTADLEGARTRVRQAGMTVNGLPIMADDPGLADYYERRVITGAEAFVEPARDFEDYTRAIKEKLLQELRPLGS